uniref:G protein-coupled receptor n=1 Tax=Panagrolaimus davidi TaxID=227884 RepID=A0A914QRY4_9BILA
MLLVTVLGPLAVIGLWIYAELSEIDLYENKVLLLKSDPYYFREIPNFISAQIQRWPLRFCCAAAYSLVLISYGITIYTSCKVWKKLKSVYFLLTPATQQMHNQMTKTMILQAFVPLVFILFPIGIVLTAVFFLVDIPGFCIICNSICCWIPVVNPLVTILSVKSYRLTVFNHFRRSFVVPT